MHSWSRSSPGLVISCLNISQIKTNNQPSTLSYVGPGAVLFGPPVRIPRHPEVGGDLLLAVGIDPEPLLVLVSEPGPQDQSPCGVEALKVWKLL